MAFRLPVQAVGACAVLMLCGCREQTAPAPPRPPRVEVPPTAAACQEFAADLEQAIADGDAGGFPRALDRARLVERVLAGPPSLADCRVEVVRDLGQTLLSPAGLAAQIIAETHSGGSYHLLRVHESQGRKRALFRLVFGTTAGVNYHDFLLVQGDDGKVRAEDFVIYFDGEAITESFRRKYLPLAVERSRSLLARLGGADAPARHYAEMGRMQDALQQGQPGRVLEICRDLPANLQTDKEVLMLRLRAAKRVNRQEYGAAIRAVRAALPDDPCLALILVDHYFMQKQFPQARETIDRLDRELGGDPYLDVLRANSYLAENDFTHARQCAQRACAAEPGLRPAWWAQVAIALQSKNFPETLRLLTILRDRLGVQFNDLTQAPEYAAFVRSPQYREWMKGKKS